MAQIKPGFKVGLLGGGQLARMLALKAHQLGFEVHALSPSAQDPVAQVVSHHHLGDLSQRRHLEIFLAQVDVATFESEFLDASLLASVSSSTVQAAPIWPRPELMGRLQDRLPQKELMQEHNLPTLPFAAVQNMSQAEGFLNQHPKGVVLKQRRFGYDGYGTFNCRNKKELEARFAQWDDKVPALIAEPRCAFKRELAISLCRNRHGQIIVFPLVESKQVNSRCLWVKGPVRHGRLKTLTQKLTRFLKKTDYVGVMTFELFDTGRELLINEIAPRVHNSAHYSLDALNLDQFSAHLLAIGDHDLKEPRAHNKGFAMMNLLGKSNVSPEWPTLSDVHLHWYGKNENRPGRKMGHLNAVAATPELALKMVQTAERKFTL
ncbi:MAG: ATP-grasp domain-containing protein [Bdellovibrionales bacterium]